MPIDIDIDEDYKIISDGNEFQLKKRSESEEGKESYRTVGHYYDLHNLFNATINKVIKDSDATNFKEIIKIVNSLKKRLDKLLEPLKMK